MKKNRWLSLCCRAAFCFPFAIWSASLYADAGTAALLPHTDLAAGGASESYRVVDDYFSEYWKEKGVLPAPAVDDAAFLRRASLAVLGVPAKAAEVQSFLADSSPDKRRLKVDELLRASRYADYWGFRLRQWITDLREVKGQGANTFMLYRYTRQAMAENRKWDRIAADLLESQGNIVYDGNANFGVYLSGEPNEMAEGAGRLFLGIKISCAQCHDDPFQETWTRKSYWSLAAYFARSKMVQMNEGGAKFDRQFPDPGRSEASVSTLLGGDAAIDGDDGEKRAIVDTSKGELYIGGKRDKESKKKDKVEEDKSSWGPPLVPTPWQGDPLADADKAGTTRRRQFVDWVTSRDNKWFAKAAVNRWFLELTGRGFVPAADGFTPDAEIAHEQLLDKLAGQFVENGYDVKWLVRTIVNSRLFQLSAGTSSKADKSENWNQWAVRPLNSDQWHDSVLRVSGREAQLERTIASAAGTFDLERNQRLKKRADLLAKARKVLTEEGHSRQLELLPSTEDVPAPAAVELSDEARKRGEEQRRKYTEMGKRLRQSREMARSQLGPAGEALMRMNGRLVTDSLRETDVPEELSRIPSPDARLTAIYIQVLGRPPESAEQQRLAPAVAEAKKERVVDLMWSLMQSTEFLTN